MVGTDNSRTPVITPSSNTSLEPLLQEIVSRLPNVSVHFSRFTVHEISLEEEALGQFQTQKILEAARLLADADVDIIADEKLWEAITAATGIPATTSVLDLNKAVKALSVTELGLVTPYLDNVQAAIVKTYATIGVDCRKERHLGLMKNTDLGKVEEPTLEEMVAEVAGRQVPAITTFCTNLRAAQRVDYWENKHGGIVLDVVATVIWDMLLQCQVDPAGVEGWERLFRVKACSCTVNR